MSKDGRSPFVQLREAALDARIFGFGGQPTGIDMSLPSNRERRTRELIQLGISKGILSPAGTFENRKIVALAMDRSSCKTIVTAASRIKWPGSEPSTPQKAHASQPLSVDERVERSRKHGVHGWTGDPKKEIDMTENNKKSDSDSADQVIAMARQIGLVGIRQHVSSPNNNPNEEVDADDADNAITLARSVGLACVK